MEAMLEFIVAFALGFFISSVGWRNVMALTKLQVERAKEKIEENLGEKK